MNHDDPPYQLHPGEHEWSVTPPPTNRDIEGSREGVIWFRYPAHGAAPVKYWRFIHLDPQ